jgi:hypothetical protein
VETGPKASLLIVIHIRIWKTLHQRFDFASNILGIDARGL